MAIANILFKITGSIAAYKSAQVISKLVQAGCDVQVVSSTAAQNFIGNATLEGLTGRPVYVETFEAGKMMSHIDLVKWADLTIIAPATGNTVNRLAQGLAGDLIGALFLANDSSKPYLLAPAMNTNMYNHPATVESLEKLRNWGVHILPTVSGYLACGDEGAGKMLEPDKILSAIWIELGKHSIIPGNSPTVLITSGGTREAIDDVRFHGNISTGKTGAALADYFTRRGNCVRLLYGTSALLPTLPCFREEYSNSTDLEKKLKKNLTDPGISVVIHLAAVSDYSPAVMYINGNSIQLPSSSKLDSSAEKMKIEYSRTPKLVEKIRNWSVNNRLKLAVFKLTAGADQNTVQQAVDTLFDRSDADLVVANDMNQRQNNNQQNFTVYKKSTRFDESAKTVNELGQIIEIEFELSGRTK